MVPARAAQLRLRQPRVRGGVPRPERRVRGAAEGQDGLARRQRGRGEVQAAVPVREELPRGPRGVGGGAVRPFALFLFLVRRHRLLRLADQVQLHDRGVRAAVAPLHRRRRERGDDGVARRRRRAAHRGRVPRAEAEQDATDRRLPAGAPVRAAEAAPAAPGAAFAEDSASNTPRKFSSASHRPSRHDAAAPASASSARAAGRPGMSAAASRSSALRWPRPWRHRSRPHSAGSSAAPAAEAEEEDSPAGREPRVRCSADS